MIKVTIIFVLFLLVVFLVIGLSLGRQAETTTSQTDNQAIITPEGLASPKTDIQASFAIFTNNTFRVFTSPMYHNLTEDLFINASAPNVIQTKRADATWDDFFATLPFKLTPKCLTTGTKEVFCSGDQGLLQFYLNGEKDNEALNKKINDGDKLLVTFGRESEKQIRLQLQKIP